MRVYELATELGIEHRDLVSKCRTLGFPVNNHMSVLDAESAGRVRAHVERERLDSVEEVKVSKTVFRRRQKKKAPLEEAAEVAAAALAGGTVPGGLKWTADLAPAPPAAPISEEPLPEPPAAEETVAEEPAEAIEVEASAPAPVAEAAEEAPAPTAAPASAGEGIAVVSIPDADELARRQAQIKEDLRRKEAAGPGRRRKGRETITKTDLYADAARFQKGAQRKKKKVVSKKGQKTLLTTPKAAKRVVKIDGGISVGDLAKQMSVKSSDVMKQLIGMGTMATINQVLDADTTTLLATEFGFEVQDVGFQESEVIEQTAEDETGFEPRAPVVTIMGHVDHGKTSLLDRIRDSDVAGGEAGGITQHIGAYNVDVEKGRLVFLDTPGHAAFTAMRARGSQATDIVVLVVAADDGVMPQTLESINHAKAAGVPLVVAVNKIDKENANVDRVRQAVAEHDLVPDDWGGDTQFVHVSAKTGDGIDQLLESILLQAELLELKADKERLATGAVLEARLETGRGVVATMLVQAGTMRIGDVVVAGGVMGRCRAMTDERGQQLKEAGPSTPVEMIGLQGVPEAGDTMDVVKTDKDAKALIVHRAERGRKSEASRRASAPRDLSALLGGDEIKELKVIVKADVQGSVEAVSDSLTALSTEKVKLVTIHQGVGAITASDVSLAAAANRDSAGAAAVLVAFNVRTARKVVEAAEREGVEIRHYDVIYDAVDELRQSMAGLLAPRIEEHFMGTAEVRKTFVIPKSGTVAGCMMTDGKVNRGAQCRLLRDQAVVWQGTVGTLRRFKDDAKEVLQGFECGIGLEGYNDVKPGDVIELFEIEEVAATLED
jgi:translation initiation factor IF-2